MQKHFHYFIMLLISLALLHTTSCRKNDPPQEEVPLCNINNMSVKYIGFADIKTYHFTYDSHGKPVSRTTPVTGTGLPNMYFFYDKYERLTDVIEPYGIINPDSLPATFAFELWIKYTYNNNDKKLRPIADTVYTFGGYQNGSIVICNGCPPKTIENYKFDASGRVGKITANRLGVISAVEYKYDAQGNLIKSGVVYDSKVNIHRSNPVWMLFDRDYSQNNPYIAGVYNSQGLPEKITGVFATFLNSNYLIFPFTDATINYVCDPK